MMIIIMQALGSVIPEECVESAQYKHHDDIGQYTEGIGTVVQEHKPSVDQSVGVEG